MGEEFEILSRQILDSDYSEKQSLISINLC